MNFYYVKVWHAEAVKSKYLHVVTDWNKEQMYKITQAFVNPEYQIVIKSCEYKATCQFLRYDPFIGLGKFLKKCKQVKLYKVEKRPVIVTKYAVLKIDWSDFVDSIAIKNCEKKYERLFIEFVSVNKGVIVDKPALKAYLKVHTRGLEWNTSSIGHFYLDNPYYDVTNVYIDKVTKTLNLDYKAKYWEDVESVIKEI